MTTSTKDYSNKSKRSDSSSDEIQIRTLEGNIVDLDPWSPNDFIRANTSVNCLIYIYTYIHIFILLVVSTGFLKYHHLKNSSNRRTLLCIFLDHHEGLKICHLNRHLNKWCLRCISSVFWTRKHPSQASGGFNHDHSQQRKVPGIYPGRQRRRHSNTQLLESQYQNHEKLFK